MNGKATRRIRRAAWQVIVSTGSGESVNAVVHKLKREYKALPYHKRNLKHMGLRSLSHREQEQRYLRVRDYKEIPQPKPVYSKENPHPDWSGYEDGEPDDHSRFKSLWRK